MEFLEKDVIDSFDSFLNVLENSVCLNNWMLKKMNDGMYSYVLNINQLGYDCDHSVSIISRNIVLINLSVIVNIDKNRLSNND